MSNTEWHLVKIIAAFAALASSKPDTHLSAIILAVLVCLVFDGLRFVGHKIENRWRNKDDH